MKKNSKIYVAGHRGLVGSAIVRSLLRQGFTNILTRTHRELDLLDKDKADTFFKRERPEYVFLAAAKVGGIAANDTYPADFIRDNVRIQTNVLDAAHRSNVTKLLFLGSACIYPRLAPQPIKEAYFLSGPLEETNIAYAVAKIAGIIMCQSYQKQYGSRFISVMPNNLYGPNDSFDLATSHVLPALLRKFHEAKRTGKPVSVWGTGKPRREFLHVDDAADACVFLMERYESPDIINIGTGSDITIRELASLVQSVTGHKGKVIWDASKPDGMPQKLLDSSKIRALGWHHTISLQDGIRKTYEWYEKYIKQVKR